MKMFKAFQYTIKSTYKSFLVFYAVYFATTLIFRLLDAPSANFTISGQDLTRTVNSLNPGVGLETMIVILFAIISAIAIRDSNLVLVANGYNRKTALVAQSMTMALYALICALLNGLVIPKLLSPEPALTSFFLQMRYPESSSLDLVTFLVLFSTYLQCAFIGIMGSLILAKLGLWSLVLFIGLGMAQIITGGLPDSFWAKAFEIAKILTASPLSLILTLVSLCILTMIINLALNRRLPIGYKASGAN